MTTIFKALPNLSRRVAARSPKLFNRLTRKAELTFAVTVAIPLKMEFHYKKDFERPPTINHRRLRPSRSA